MGHDTIINDMAICIVVAWLLAVAAQIFKQPLILAYLIAGFAVGPWGGKLIMSTDNIQTISKLGLILLLFMIGLEIDLKKVLSAGRLITITGTTQIIGGCLLGLLVFWLFFPFGKQALEVLYLSVAAALSSTVIIVKILYDRRDLDSLPGRLTLGILVLQDIFAIIFLALQPNLSEPSFAPLVSSLVKAAVLVVVALTASRYALPPVFKAVARLPELVLVGALAWCFMMAELAEKFQLSREMGALVAGVAISTFPYTLDVVAKVTSLRDFFVTLFFVALGMKIPMPTGKLVFWSLAFCLFVVVSRFLTVFVPLNRMKQGHRASLLPALYLCQVSEFSLVILSLGEEKGHINSDVTGLVSYAFVFLAVGSTYAMLRSDSIMKRAALLLSDLDIRDLDEQTMFITRPKNEPRIFLLGFSWSASSLIEELTRHNPSLLNEMAVIDFNPQVNEGLRKRGVYVKYGDVSQRETLIHAGVGDARIIVCTLPNTVLKGINNLRLLQQLREINPRAHIVMHAELLADVPKLYEAGASYVIVPRLYEAAELRSALEAARRNLIEEKRYELDAQLANRKEVIP